MLINLLGIYYAIILLSSKLNVWKSIAFDRNFIDFTNFSNSII